MFINLKSLILNHKSRLYSVQGRTLHVVERRILLFVLLPFVLYGLYYVYENTNSKGIKTYAQDPLIVTYQGGPPPNPMFSVSDMFPGDEVEKIFNVENDSPEEEGVTMDGIKTQELKAFAGILDVEIAEVASSTPIFSGKLQAFFDSPPITLSSFPAGSDKNFRVKVKFPFDASNDYQEAKVVFNIIWQTTSAPIVLPPECAQLAGVITSVIEGTEGNDRIRGTVASELIIAKGGEDRVDAGRGDDCIVGGEGSDRDLDGGEGSDIILGGNGNDDIDGGSGNDTIYGNDGNDHIDAGAGDDTVYAGFGNDKIDGGAGKDKIYADEGNDHVDGDSGDDEIYGGAGNDKLEGSSGNDKLYGEEGNDDLRGDSGNDYLDGGPDIDVLRGNTGTDTCVNSETTFSCEL